jgi:hypothetical protein
LAYLWSSLRSERQATQLAPPAATACPPHRAQLSRQHHDASDVTAWRVRNPSASYHFYLGTANTELIEYARSLRPRFRTGILSNSFVGAREREQAIKDIEALLAL